MRARVDIIEGRSAHLPGLLTLYPLAFPEEDLTGLLQELIGGDAPVLSLVAIAAGDVVGHVLFTRFDEGAGALLGPLAVQPGLQRSGIGTRLVRDGLARLKNLGVRQVLVLGDPGYYARFGFHTERQVLPPYALPEEWQEAWQSLCFGAGPLPPGQISLPDAWMRPELWGP